MFTYFVPPDEAGTPTTQRIIAALSRSGSFQPAEPADASTAAAPACCDLVWALSGNVDNHTASLRRTASVSAQLLGTDVLEDKAQLAILQQRMRCPTLPTSVLEGRAQLEAWCRRTFQAAKDDAGCGLWVIKQANSNGGAGLCFVSQRNWRLVLSSWLPPSAPEGSSAQSTSGDDLLSDQVFVAQRYVERPLLWRSTGRKFHLRVYLVTRRGGDQAFLYPKAFAHVANAPLSFALGASQCFAYDPAEHMTNVSASAGDSRFLGYFIVDLAAEFPEGWANIVKMAASLAAASAPFLRRQLRPADFTLVGLDVMLDEDHGAWLLEANVPPCMGSQTGHQTGQSGDDQSDGDCQSDGAGPLHDEYLAAMIEQFVLPPLRQVRARKARAQACTTKRRRSLSSDASKSDAKSDAKCDAEKSDAKCDATRDNKRGSFPTAATATASAAPTRQGEQTGPEADKGADAPHRTDAAQQTKAMAPEGDGDRPGPGATVSSRQWIRVWDGGCEVLGAANEGDGEGKGVGGCDYEGTLEAANDAAWRSFLVCAGRSSRSSSQYDSHGVSGVASVPSAPRSPCDNDDGF